MSSFFFETAKARLYQNKNKYPLLKLLELLDWSEISVILTRLRKSTRGDNRGKQAYDPLKMFKAVLLGQWHSLSDPELEHALAVRADFLVFCEFDDMELPDHSTLNRFRNYLIEHEVLDKLLRTINHQLALKKLKVEKATIAVVDASIIESHGAPLKKALIVEVDDSVTETPISKDSDARWTKKAGRYYLGYKLHALTDQEGYIDALGVTPANVHDSKYFTPLLENIPAGTTVFADKGYASQELREVLVDKDFADGIMHKAYRNTPLTKAQHSHNNRIKKHRYVVEQTFGTLKQKFNFRKARYFSCKKVLGQSYLKAMCLNLLKAMNKFEYT